MGQNWAKLNIEPGACVRPIGSGKQVWEVIAIDYQRQRLKIERNLFQKWFRLDQIVGLTVVNGTIQECPIEVLCVMVGTALSPAGQVRTITHHTR